MLGVCNVAKPFSCAAHLGRDLYLSQSYCSALITLRALEAQRRPYSSCH